MNTVRPAGKLRRPKERWIDNTLEDRKVSVQLNFSCCSWRRH